MRERKQMQVILLDAREATELSFSELALCYCGSHGFLPGFSLFLSEWHKRKEDGTQDRFGISEQKQLLLPAL